MNGFINNIISRHSDPVANIMPRLPGKFEPVNFPAVNSTEEFSVDTRQPFNSTYGITETGIENKREENTNYGKSITPVHTRASDDQNIQTLNDNAGVFEESENTGRTSIIKNIIHEEKDAPKKKHFKEKIPLENSDKHRSESFEISPTKANLLKEKPVDEHFNRQELSGRGLNQKPNSLNFQIGIVDEQSSIIKQKSIRPASEKRTLLSEDSKSFQASLIQPAIKNLNSEISLTSSPILREQDMSSVIKVSIGRIEVRAVTSVNPVTVKSNVLQKPKMSLDEYLKKRNGAEK